MMMSASLPGVREPTLPSMSRAFEACIGKIHSCNRDRRVLAGRRGVQPPVSSPAHLIVSCRRRRALALAPQADKRDYEMKTFRSKRGSRRAADGDVGRRIDRRGARRALRAPARSSCVSQSCAKAAISRAFSSLAGWPRRRSTRRSRRPTSRHLGPLGSTSLSATTPSMGHIPVRSPIRWVWSLAKTSLQKSESVRALLGGARL
jgi:hypothetical protein